MIEIKQLKNTNEDVECVVAFLEKIDSSFPIPLSEKVNLTEYTEKQLTYGKVIVAKDGENIVGIILGYVNDSVGYVSYISTLGVLVDYQSQGIGTMLLDSMKVLAHDSGMKSLSLYTHKTNHRAVSFYQRNGFQIDTTPNTERVDDIHLILSF